MSGTLGFGYYRFAFPQKVTKIILINPNSEIIMLFFINWSAVKTVEKSNKCVFLLPPLPIPPDLFHCPSRLVHFWSLSLTGRLSPEISSTHVCNCALSLVLSRGLESYWVAASREFCSRAGGGTSTFVAAAVVVVPWWTLLQVGPMVELLEELYVNIYHHCRRWSVCGFACSLLDGLGYVFGLLIAFRHLCRWDRR